MASKQANKQQTLGELITGRLLELGWSNAELARRTGFSATYISNLARDIAPGTRTGKPKRVPDETVERIAKALSIPVDRARTAAGLSKKEDTTMEADTDDREAEAARAAEFIKGFLKMSRERQSQLLAIMQILDSDHPELLQTMTPPIQIIDDTDLIESDAKEDTGNTPPP